MSRAVKHGGGRRGSAGTVLVQYAVNLDFPRKSQPAVLAMGHDDQGVINNPNVFNSVLFLDYTRVFQTNTFFKN